MSCFIAAALGVDKPEEIARVYPGALYLGRENGAGFGMRRISLPFSGRRRTPPDGARALLGECGYPGGAAGAPADFGLLYSTSGTLAGIFPLPGAGSRAGSVFRYFDLTDFSMSLSQLRRLAGNAAPGRFKARWLECRAAVERCKAAWLADRPGLLLEKNCVRNALGGEAASYAEVGFDGRGRWRAGAWPSFADETSPLRRRLVLPVFPTVFSPAHAGNRLADAEYYEALYKGLPLKKGGKVLVLGTGSGVDAWITSLRTGAGVCAAGMNPFEVANTRACAALGGFGVRACQCLGVTGAGGGRVFPGETFDAVACNALMISVGAAPAALAEHHDRDPGGELFLKPFARALPSFLKAGRGARALLWCRAEGAGSAAGEQALIAGLLERGTREGGREFAVRAEGSLYFLEAKP